MEDLKEDRRITLRTLSSKILRGLDVCGNGSELFQKEGFLTNSIRHLNSSVNKSPSYEAKLEVAYLTKSTSSITAATLYKQRLQHVRVACMLLLTLRLLMSYIYIYIYMEHLFLMFLDHTQRRSTVGRTPLDE